MKTITIGNEEFTLKKNGTFFYNARSTVWDVYNRPSKIKVGIFQYWDDWARENNVYDFGICSYNCMMFTLSGKIYIAGNTYAIYITKTRQEIYPLF